LAPGKKSRTILHFGTDRTAQLARSRNLNRMGYEVLNSTNGFEAIQLACLDVVDAVVLDQEGNLAEVELVAAEIKRSRPQVPTILLVERAPSRARGPALVDAMVSQNDNVSVLVTTLEALLPKESAEPAAATE